MVKHNLLTRIDFKIMVISHISFLERLKTLQKVKQSIFKFMSHFLAQRAADEVAGSRGHSLDACWTAPRRGSPVSSPRGQVPESPELESRVPAPREEQSPGPAYLVVLWTLGVGDVPWKEGGSVWDGVRGERSELALGPLGLVEAPLSRLQALTLLN